MPYSLAFRLGATYVEARHFDLVNAGDYAQYVRNIKGNRVANEVLLDAIGLTLRPELDNDYYREALEYHLGLLYAHLGQPELQPSISSCPAPCLMRAATRFFPSNRQKPQRSASTSWWPLVVAFRSS